MPAVEAKDDPKPKKEKSPYYDRAKACCDKWWESLNPKPLGKDTFRNTVKVAMAALEGGWADDSLTECMIASGQSISTGSLNYQQSRLASGKGQVRVANGNTAHWARGGGFYEKEWRPA